jgi:hypothetical protein
MEKEKIKKFFRPTKFKLLFTFLLAVAMIAEFFLLFYIDGEIWMHVLVGGAYTVTIYASPILVIGEKIAYYILNPLLPSSIIGVVIGYTFFIILCTICSYLLICLLSSIYKHFKNKKIPNIIILFILLVLFFPFPITIHESALSYPPHLSTVETMEKVHQNFRVLLHECNKNKICFELRASLMNSLDIPANESVISVYVDDEYKPLGEWKIGSGTTCKGNTKALIPGESCYGYVNVSSCEPGETHTLKIVHAWGAEEKIPVECK